MTSDLRLLKLARFQMLKWLQEVLENKDNGPQIRAKAIKALSEWAQVDVTLLSRPQIAGCFQKALGVSPEYHHQGFQSMNLMQRIKA